MTDAEFTAQFREHFRVVIQKMLAEDVARHNADLAHDLSYVLTEPRSHYDAALRHANFMLDGAIDQLGDFLKSVLLEAQNGAL